MKWIMAVLAVLALTEAALAACPAAQAHAMAQAAETAQSPAASSVHDHAAMAAQEMPGDEADCHNAAETVAVESEVCTECSGAMSCGECALLTAAEIPSFDAAAPPLEERHKASLGAVAPARPLAFEPPPPKG